MPFNDSIKRKVKERAHYRCCLCRTQWAAHVHHIIPEAEDGPNTEDNAAPLCANCHDLYGDNPKKRRFIKDSRDFWYGQCDKSSPPNPEMIREIHDHLHKEVVTKADLDNALKPLYDIVKQNLPPSKQLQAISDVTAAISTAAISDAIVMPLIRQCPNCQSFYSRDQYACTHCGWFFSSP